MKIYFFLFALLVAFITPASVSGHVLKTDGSIGAVLHVSPEDDPVVGEEASFFFEFKDKENKFTPSACVCTVHIVKGEQVVFSDQLFNNAFPDGLNSPVLNFAFPERGIYTVSVSGKPVTTGAFKEFTLRYDVRVSRGQANTAENTGSSGSSGHTLHFILLGGVFVVFFGLAILQKFKAKTAGK